MKITRKELKRLIIHEMTNDPRDPGRSIGRRMSRYPSYRSTMKPFSLGNLNEGQTLVIDYRSPPSGLGALEPSGIVIQHDGSSPALDADTKTSHFNSEMEEREDYQALAQWLKTNHNVTHVRDNEMPHEYDLHPKSGELFKLDEWVANVMKIF